MAGVEQVRKSEKQMCRCEMRGETWTQRWDEKKSKEDKTAGGSCAFSFLDISLIFSCLVFRWQQGSRKWCWKVWAWKPHVFVKQTAQPVLSVRGLGIGAGPLGAPSQRVMDSDLCPAMCCPRGLILDLSQG